MADTAKRPKEAKGEKESKRLNKLLKRIENNLAIRELEKKPEKLTPPAEG